MSQKIELSREEAYTVYRLTSQYVENWRRLISSGIKPSAESSYTYEDARNLLTKLKEVYGW